MELFVIQDFLEIKGWFREGGGTGGKALNTHHDQFLMVLLATFTVRLIFVR